MLPKKSLRKTKTTDGLRGSGIPEPLAFFVKLCYDTENKEDLIGKFLSRYTSLPVRNFLGDASETQMGETISYHSFPCG